MEIFNVKRRDVYNFDNWMDLKKQGFGGPNSAESLKDKSGKFSNKDRKLKDYQSRVERHDLFKNQVFDPTYKAMGGDLVHKQDVGKNPYTYADQYNNMGIATVNVGKTNEGLCYSSFESFVLESDANVKKIEKSKDCECGDDCECDNCKEHSNESFGFGSLAGGLAAASRRSRRDDSIESKPRRRSEAPKYKYTLDDVAMDMFGCEFLQLKSDTDKRQCLAAYSKLD